VDGQGRPFVHDPVELTFSPVEVRTLGEGGDPLVVMVTFPQRRASNTGVISVCRQQVALGRAHAHQTVTVHVAEALHRT
jgi:hypothetical protein